jgi:homoserine O-acetyltransferase
MDTWDPQRGCAMPAEVFGRIRAQLCMVGISSDWLFPPEDVRRFADTIRETGVQVDYKDMISEHGHDAFLAEQAALVQLLQ